MVLEAYAYLHICLSVCWFVNMITAECLDQESPFCHALRAIFVSFCHIYVNNS